MMYDSPCVVRTKRLWWGGLPWPAVCACLLWLSICAVLHAQNEEPNFMEDTPKDTTYWRFSGVSTLNFAQTSFTNWASGGDNNLALAIIGNYAADYEKGKLHFNNILDVGYGLVKTGAEPMRKNEDKIDLVSRLGYEARKNLYYSTRLNFKSQFAPGYEYPDDSTVVSRIMAPAFLLLSLGMDYKPWSWLSIYASPVTNKTTFVLDQKLADQGLYGVEGAVFNADSTVVLEPGENVRMELGAIISVQLQKKFNDLITLNSRADFFNNYSDPNKDNRVNIDVNWETLLVLNFNKWLAVSVFAHIIYDDDIDIPIIEEVNGEEVQVGAGPRTQFKQILGVAITYKFNTESRK